jgi:hypothetical protein
MHLPYSSLSSIWCLRISYQCTEISITFFTRLSKEGTADIFVRPAGTVTSNKQLTISESKFRYISEPTEKGQLSNTELCNFNVTISMALESITIQALPFCGFLNIVGDYLIWPHDVGSIHRATNYVEQYKHRKTAVIQILHQRDSNPRSQFTRKLKQNASYTAWPSPCRKGGTRNASIMDFKLNETFSPEGRG